MPASLPHAYVNFLCLLGWSPKDNREQMSREELIEAFKLEGVNRSNAVVNFTEEDPDRSEGVVVELAAYPRDAGGGTRRASAARMCERPAGRRMKPRCCKVTPLIRERIRVLNEVLRWRTSSLSTNCRLTIRPN